MTTKDPWRDDMTPEEFKEHYEAKLDRLEELSGECNREGCSETAPFPRNYCSDVCRDVGVRKTAERFYELIESVLEEGAE